MRNFLKEIKEKVLLFDGSKGVMLQQMGLKGGQCPDEWNYTHSDEVRKVYTLYKDAGSDVIQTNTFQGTRAALEKYGFGDKTYDFNFEGARLARNVMGRDGFVAASIGPIGRLFEPSGDLTFNEAYELYKEQIIAVVEGGVDIINFETFTDIGEMRAALLAAKENTNLPVICSIAFEANGKTLMGTDPYTAAIILKSLGADMIGTNCSLGPEQLIDIIRKMSEAGDIYLSVKPNAGLPEMVDGKAVFKETPEKFAALAKEYVKYGVRLIGGCCGTTPEHIKAIKKELDGLEVPKAVSKTGKIITSAVKALALDSTSQLSIGKLDVDEDDSLMKELKAGNIEYIVDTALDMACEGYDAIYINTDNAYGDDELLAKVVNAAQGYLKEPFIIETCNYKALDNALRLYKGKAGVVLNRCGEDAMGDLLLIAKKYGSTVIDHSEVL